MPPSTTSGHPSSSANNNALISGGLWSDLPRRATVLLIGIPIIGIILSHPFTSWLFFQGVHLLSAWEWLVLVPPSAANYKKDEDDKVQSVVPHKSLAMYAFPLISCALSNLTRAEQGNNQEGLFLCSLVAAACLLSLLESNNAHVCNHLLKGLLFLTVPMRAWNKLSQDFAATAYLLSVVWNCDTGALVVGRLSKSLLGANRIPPPQWLQRISPAKSVEGIVGGLLFGCLTSTTWPFLWSGLVVLLEGINNNSTTKALIPSIATGNQTLSERLLLGLILSALGIVGDLWESSTKRQGGVKDSGKLLPGHGGILDRFDSSLLPVLCCNYMYFQK